MRWGSKPVAIAYAATTLTFFSAVRFTTAANATILQHTSPIYIAFLGAVFLGERTSLKDWTALAAVLFGVVLCLRSSLGFHGHTGNILALASGR